MLHIYTETQIDITKLYFDTHMSCVITLKITQFHFFTNQLMSFGKFSRLTFFFCSFTPMNRLKIHWYWYYWQNT